MATGGGSPGRPHTVPFNAKEPFNSDSDEFEHLRQPRTPEKQARMPTFKEFGETIKGLRDENFQLKVRIYLLEKDGKTLNGQSGIHNLSEGPPSAVQVELMREFQNLKQSNEALQLKASDSDNRYRHMAQQLEESEKEKEDLICKNEILIEKLNVFEREVAMLKLKKDEDDEIERCVRAFHGDSDFGSVRVPSDMEMELLEARSQIEIYVTKEQSWNEERVILEEELEKCKFELKEKELYLEEKEVQAVKDKRCIQKKDEQFRNVLKTLKDLGDKFKTEESRSKILEAKCKNYKATLAHYRETSKRSEKKAGENIMTLKANEQKFSKIESIIRLLEPRVGALVSFASNVVDLESRGILTLTAFTTQYRNNLADTVHKCREFWEMLAKALAEDWVEESKLEADKLKNSKLGQMQTELIELCGLSGSPEESPSDSSLKTSVNAEMVSKSIQCDPDTDVEEAAVTNANLLQAEKQQLQECRNLLETEKTKFQEDKNNLDLERIQLEDTKGRLVSEKAMLYARVATLEANLSALKDLSYPLQIDNLEKQIEERTLEKRKLERKLQNEKTRVNLFESENRKLFERLQAAENALKKLHKEHARMVLEMDKVKSMCPIPEEFERMLNERCLNKENRQDSSPDLGIESGHDALSTISSSKQFSSYSKPCDEIKILKQHNKELASKLKHTKLTLDKTIEKLEKASLEKELRDRAVCRTLHQTHSLLRVAKSDIILEEREVPSDL